MNGLVLLSRHCWIGGCGNRGRCFEYLHVQHICGCSYALLDLASSSAFSNP